MKKSKILIVEDNESNIRLMQLFFEDQPFEITFAKDGLAAIQKTIDEKPDLILLDLGLPKLAGWEVASRLKERPDTQEIPIIALTAHAMVEEKKRALDSGCNDFETKPINFESLTEKITCWIKNSQDEAA